MLNIYSRVEDLECTEHWEKADELKEKLTESFEEFTNDRGVVFYWLDNESIEIEDGCSEDEISEMLDEVYDEFIENLEKENDEEED